MNLLYAVFSPINSGRGYKLGKLLIFNVDMMALKPYILIKIIFELNGFSQIILYYLLGNFLYKGIDLKIEILVNITRKGQTMVGNYQGEFSYDKTILTNWDSTAGGVYYLGYKNAQNHFVVTYVGKASSEGGIRGRLLQHVNAGEWSDITVFGYKVCSTEKEALDHEAAEIERLKPLHNKIGK